MLKGNYSEKFKKEKNTKMKIEKEKRSDRTEKLVTRLPPISKEDRLLMLASSGH